MKRIPRPDHHRNMSQTNAANADQKSSTLVSGPDEKEGGHGHQRHKQIKRSNNSMETCPH